MSIKDSKNQVTVPAKVRERINAEPGDQIVSLKNEKDEIVISVVKKNSLLTLFGSMPPRGETTEKEWGEIRKQAKNEISES